MKQIGKGKVRDIYDVGNELVLVTSDRVSAFDVVLPNKVPNKGVVLNKISAFWFNYTSDIIDNHMISIDNADMPRMFQEKEYKGRCMLVQKLKMLPVECIVRGYISGSGWESYKKTEKINGIELKKGITESEKLETPIFTPTTKAEEGHDEAITFEELCSIIGENTANMIKNKSIEIYLKCEKHARERGIIIADTKFEFGVRENGDIVLADEVLTPDSSRFWPKDEYLPGKPQNSYDKQFIRDWLKNSGWDKKPPAPVLPDTVINTTVDKYIEAYEKLTGTKFEN